MLFPEIEVDVPIDEDVNHAQVQSLDLMVNDS